MLNEICVCRFGYETIEWEDLFKMEIADYKEQKVEDKSITKVDSIQDSIRMCIK